MQPRRENRPTRDLIIIFAFVVVASLPFINMPVHMDDAIHMAFARMQVESPFQQDIRNYDYFGDHYDSFRDTHPRGHSLFLSLLLRLDPSEAEAPLHLAFLIFPVIAGASMYFLSRRFGAPPLLATLLLMAAPAVFVMFHSLMTDGPGMALWLAAVTAYIFGVDRRSFPLLGLATLALLAGVFVSYQVLSAIPLLAAYAAIKRRVNWNNAVPVAVPALAFGLSVLQARLQYHAWPVFSYHVGMSLSAWELVEKIRGIGVIIGGTAVMPVVVWLALTRKQIDAFILAAAVVVTATVDMLFFLVDSLTVNQLILSLVFFPTTAMIVWRFAAELLFRTPDSTFGNRRDAAFLSLWVVGVIFYSWILAPYAAPRYLLPLMAPVAIMVAAGLKRVIGPNSRALFLTSLAAVAATLSISIPVAVSDYDRADVYREAAGGFRQQYGGSGTTVWFDGEMGFRNYMEREGFRMLMPDDNSPRPGDIIIMANLAYAWEPAPDVMSRVELVDTITDYGRLPVVTFNFADESAMYGSRGLMLPYAFKRDFSETFWIMRVVR